MRARDFGLVDEIGDLNEALQSAAELADLRTYTVVPMELPLPPFARFLMGLSSVPFAADLLAHTSLLKLADAQSVSLLAAPMQLLEAVERLWVLPAHLNDPNSLYLHCEVCNATRY